MAQNISEQLFEKAEIVVFKVGSSLIVDQNGVVRTDWVDSLAEEVRDLMLKGKKAVIVSSGAVALGRRALKLGLQKLTLSQKQAAAAVGQIELSTMYQQILGIKKINAAQVLLTQENANDEHTFINAVATLKTLLEMNAVPIINENDTVTAEEIKFGDNDRLSAVVAQMVGADVLVLLSDIDGLYSEDPKENPKAKFYPVIKKITPEIEQMASPTKTALGTGGMKSKLMAGQICLGIGCNMVITTGKELYPVRRLVSGQKCTWFTAEEKNAATVN